MKRITKEEQPFERLEISKEDLLRLFGVRYIHINNSNNHISVIISIIHLKFEFLMKKFIHLQQLFIGMININMRTKHMTSDAFSHFRCGPLIDLCRGPHIRHTGKVKALAITKVGYFSFIYFYRQIFILWIS